ncbi:MAG: response regulator, partial [Calditrichaeota bacterium]|nr:response regulator [Calditrichota bacterium]
TPPFWQTGWFYTAVLLAVGLLIFSTYKYRVRSIQAHNQLLGREVQARTRELLTQKEELEDSLRIRERIEQELRVQKEKAEAASKSKSEFLANMSHEIRTPMNGVIGMTDLLLETHLTHDQHDLAKTVMSSANSLLNIIDDILDFSKIEAGKIELEEIELDLLEVVESVSAILAPKAHEKNLEYFLITAPELPVHYYGDPVRLRQVIINLVNNAIKFTHKGEIILMVTEEATEGQTTTLRFSVRDTGIGIPKDRLNRLFKSFSQVDSSVTRQYGGTGLGLAISKSLAELMGGEIGVNSQEGEGSEFWFTIRLRKQANAVSRTFDPGLLRGHRVLIVDDHPVNRHLLIEHFKGTDCELQVAEHGGEAWHKLQKAQKSGEPFTICISDYWMPVMDGEELVRRVRADSRFENLKMMLITASISRGDLHKVVEAGYDSYMMKPITRRRMWANLANLIGADPSTNGLRESISESETPARQAGRLLLVEDNKVNQKVAQKMLENLGYGVDIAGDGVEALKAVDHQTYDLIFMDIQMPNLDGLSATRAIREKESDQPPVPIVALTANAMKGDREKCLEAGMNDYLSKPFKKKELLEILNKFFA